MSKYFTAENVNRDNLGAFYLDEENKVVIVELINNNKEEQEKFIEQVNVNSKYIKFEQGGPYVTSEIDLIIITHIMKQQYI